MPHVYRHRRGDTRVVMAPVESATVIHVGDLIKIASHYAIPASSQGAETNLVDRQDSFNDGFLGVALSGSDAGDTQDVAVATDGDFEFDCAAATFGIGDLVGPAAADSGNLLADQKVAAVADGARAIGRVVKRYASNTTRVLVRIQSTLLTGGPFEQPISG